MPGHEPGEDACFRDPKLAWLGRPRSRLWWKKGISPRPSLGMRFSPLRLSHRLRRHRPPLLNSYPSFKTHPQSAQPKPTPLLPAPPVYCSTTTTSNALGWEQASPPSSPLAPAAHGGTTDSIRAESKLRAFLLPLELPVQYLVHGSCSMRLN